MRSSRLDWLLFLVLGGIWGSSYLFIKVGVDAGLPPLTLVTLRLAIGFALLATVVGVARERLPREPRTYGHLVVMAVLSIALPFSLIASAEQSVDSALAATIGAAIPIVVVPVAAAVFPAERLTPGKVAGIVVGLVGVAVLVGLDPSSIAGREPLAVLALIGATVSYGLGGVYSRWAVHGLRPMIPALFQVGFALVIVAVAAFLFERPLAVDLRPEAVLAVVWLGLLGSGAAYLIFFGLLGRWGAGRTSLVAYVLPVVGIVLGVGVLHEPVHASLLAGAGLIIVAILLVNRGIPVPASVRRRVAPLSGRGVRHAGWRTR